ncbi:MAG: hypothetical protein IPO00_08285 [Betaproteobacteria bacterium]|nr:hypothetical protein [Betaproteobacteria bacterium]
MMPERRILYLSTHQMAAFHWQGGTVRAEGSFELSPSGFDAFGAYVAAHPKSIFTLLVNLAEEGFQLETIPFLQGNDRSTVITRKLSQLFYTTPYTASISLGHEKTRRKDEKLLLAALTGQAALDPWVSALRDARAAIAGIYSLPFLGEVLLKKLKIADEHCILLTLQDQTIRETYFERGKLHFSRLSPLTHTSIGGIAQAFATEAVKLQQYLLSQRLIARNQSLRAIVVAHPQAMQAVETSCISTELLAFHIASTDECSGLVGLKTAPTTSHADTIFSHIVAATPPVAQFAKPALRRDYRLWQVRNALLGFGAAVLLTCALFAAKQFYGTYTLSSEAEAISAQAMDARQRYEEIARTFPVIPTSNETLRQIMNRYAELESNGASPELLYREISAALSSAPAVDIGTIEWRTAGAASTTGNQPAAALSDSSGQTALIRGTLNLGTRATPRQILQAFQQFVDTLSANPALQVQVIQQPFDVDSGKALRSGNDGTADTGARPFALEITRRKAS